MAVRGFPEEQGGASERGDIAQNVWGSIHLSAGLRRSSPLPGASALPRLHPRHRQGTRVCPRAPPSGPRRTRKPFPLKVFPPSETPGTVRGIKGETNGDDDDPSRSTKPSRFSPDQRPRRPKIGRQTTSSPSGAGAGLMPSARLGPLFSFCPLPPPSGLDRVCQRVRVGAATPKPFRILHIAAHRWFTRTPPSKP